MARVFATRNEAELYRYTLPLADRWETIHFTSNMGREGYVIRRKPKMWREPVKEVGDVRRDC
jgi:hypothetical protein